MERGVRSFGIVIAFDLFKDRKLQFLQGMVGFTVCFFFLKNKRFFEILIVFVAVVRSREKPPSVCVIYCNRWCSFVSTF